MTSDLLQTFKVKGLNAKVTVFKVIRSYIQIAITPPRIVEFCSNLVQSSSRHMRHTRNVHSQRSKVKVTA